MKVLQQILLIIISLLFIVEVGAFDKRPKIASDKVTTHQYKSLLTLAKDDFKSAQTLLGLLFISGEVGRNKHSLGRDWLLKSAKQGEPTAQFRLSLYYKKKNQVKESEFWLNKATDNHYFDTPEQLTKVSDESTEETQDKFEDIKIQPLLNAGLINIDDFLQELEKGIVLSPNYLHKNLRSTYHQNYGLRPVTPSHNNKK